MALAIAAVVSLDDAIPALPGPLHEGADDEIARVIARLVAADVFGPPGVFQPNILGWRIERWIDGPAGINLCIKRNWARELNLVASLYVPRALQVAPVANLAINLARARELETVARRGLAASFASLRPPWVQDPETPEARVFIPFEVRGTYFP